MYDYTVFSPKEDNYSRNGLRKTTAGRGGQLQARPEDCKIKIVPERSRPPESPDQNSRPRPRPRHYPGPDRKQSTGARGHASARSPAQHGWRQRAGTAPRRAVDPAVARRGGSQSAPAASAGRPLNSARQLPAVWRVHSAMQYVCQRCGTKEQPFCDWAGHAPRCQSLRELLPTPTTELPPYFIIRVPMGTWGKGSSDI